MKKEANIAGSTNYFSPKEVEQLRVFFPFTTDSWTRLPDALQPNGSLKLIYDHDESGKKLQRILNAMAGIAGLVIEEVESQGEYPIG